jgi:outer membrane protein assembly factor BamE (lipoprotein component of BamABCDE complex)
MILNLHHFFKMHHVALRISLASGLIAILSACATAPKAGMPGAQARQLLGEPMLIVRTAEGVRWFYPTGPLGTTTRAVNVDRADLVTDVRNVLVDDVIQTITVGLAANDVLARIGPPHQRIRFDNLRATAWDYRYQDTWGYTVDLSVMIDDANRVTGRVAQRLEIESGSK